MLTHFTIVQQGESHKQSAAPCQDYALSKRIAWGRTSEGEAIIAVGADGVGSCDYSEHGARAAVEAAMEHLEQTLGAMQSLESEAVLGALNAAFEHALSAVRQRAQELDVSVVLMDCTLVAAVYDGEHLWHGNIGDSGIVVLHQDGTYALATQRQCGQEAHSLFPLREKSLWSFGAEQKPTAAFALMTDGILDYGVRSSMRGNGVYFPFFRQSLTTVMDSDEAAAACREEWDGYFAGDPQYEHCFRSEVTDDLTFVAAQNPAAVAALPEIVFDHEKWSEEDRVWHEEQAALLKMLALQNFEQWNLTHAHARRRRKAKPAPQAEDAVKDMETQWLSLEAECRNVQADAEEARARLTAVRTYHSELEEAVQAYEHARALCRAAEAKAEAFGLRDCGDDEQEGGEMTEDADIRRLKRWAKQMRCETEQCEAEVLRIDQQVQTLCREMLDLDSRMEKRLAKEEREQIARFISNASGALRSGACQALTGAVSMLESAVNKVLAVKEDDEKPTVQEPDGAEAQPPQETGESS